MVFMIMLLAGFFTTSFMALGGADVIEAFIFGISGGNKLVSIMIMLMLVSF